MFLPPEQRHPGSSPGDPPPSRPAPPSRGEALGIWLIGLLLVATILAPMGGSTVLEALWHVLRR